MTDVLPTFRRATIVVAILCASSAAQAQQYLIDQPPNASGGGYSDLACGACGDTSARIAEDFVLAAPATILEVQFRGAYDQDQEFPDAFTLEIYADSSGLPATSPLVSESGLAPVVEITTSTQLPNMEHRHIFVLHFSNPIPLTAGTYWLLIANDSTGQSGDFLWESGDLDATNGLPGSASSFGSAPFAAFSSDYAFSLPVVLFADGFESGNTSAWSAAP